MVLIILSLGLFISAKRIPNSNKHLANSNFSDHVNK